MTEPRAQGTSAVIFDDRGMILLVQREDFRLWALPGGGIEEGESGAEGARREVTENVGRIPRSPGGEHPILEPPSIAQR